MVRDTLTQHTGGKFSHILFRIPMNLLLVPFYLQERTTSPHLNVIRLSYADTFPGPTRSKPPTVTSLLMSAQNAYIGCRLGFSRWTKGVALSHKIIHRSLTRPTIKAFAMAGHTLSRHLSSHFLAQDTLRSL